MSHPRVICPAGSTPAVLKTVRLRRRALPDDVLRQASRRLGALSLVGAALWVIALVEYRLVLGPMMRGGADWRALQPTDAIAAVSVAISIGLFFYTRKGSRDPRLVMDLGLVYMVVTALGIGLTGHWEHVPPGTSTMPMISWVGAVVLMFAAIVPSTPGKTLVAGLIAASMNPAAMLVARARGTWDFGPASGALMMHYPDYLLVGVAVVISHVVTELGGQITKAREMGSYQLGELLGRGGMGEVYRATHRMLARPAAIKLIRPEMIVAAQGEGAQVAVKRFRREAEVAANLRSPHTVELYDFGVTEDETLYFVMELLEGMDLESLVRDTGPVPPARAIHILRQVCESLEEAHASGLVHRDIKPANIHVGRLGLQHDFVKVLDFGLVKSIRGDNTEESLATAAGVAAGTPAYMAPEMALGEPFDGRSDLYALGCVAYYMLTGQRVFEASNHLQVLAKHLRDAPDPFAKRVAFHVPAELEQLVLACVAKKPADRPQSAADLSRSLAAIEITAWDEAQAKTWWQLERPA